MADDLADIDRLVSALLAGTAAPERRKLLRALARGLRASQSARIGRQENPDGSAYAPRRQPAKRLRRQGQLRRGAMFRKLRSPAYLRFAATADEAWVGFAAGAITRIARVHQDGGQDRAAKGGPLIRYARRVLIGLSPLEIEHLCDNMVAAISLS